MKIKLGKCSRFEPKNETLRTYVICVIALIVIGYITNTKAYVSIIFVGLETLLLLWLETVYYPYGIKEGD